MVRLRSGNGKQFDDKYSKRNPVPTQHLFYGQWARRVIVTGQSTAATLCFEPEECSAKSPAETIEGN